MSHLQTTELNALRIVKTMCPDIKKEILSFVSPVVIYNTLNIGPFDPDREVDYIDSIGNTCRIISIEKYNWFLERLNFHRRRRAAGESYESTDTRWFMEQLNFHRRRRYAGQPDESRETPINYFTTDKNVDKIQQFLDSSRHMYACKQISMQMKNVNFIVNGDIWYKLKI